MNSLGDIAIVLGSQSPRRQELFQEMGFDFEVVVKAVDESFETGQSPKEIVEQIAVRKVEAFKDPIFKDKLIITADTVVVYQGDIYGKPLDQKDAIRMLTSLQGDTHQVLTAVAIAYKGKQHSFVEETFVEFYSLSPEEILFYLNNYAPYDKAGSYGIQEWIGTVSVKSIRGSFENVVGLPTARLYQELKLFFGLS